MADQVTQERIQELVDWLNEKWGNEDKSFHAKPSTNFFKITVYHYGQTSAYAFVAKKNFSNKSLGIVYPGEIFKPASWNRPARYMRGQLFDSETWTCCGEFGVAYLR